MSWKVTFLEILAAIVPLDVGCRYGAVVRAPTSHQCDPVLIPRLGVICGLSLLVSTKGKVNLKILIFVVIRDLGLIE